MKISKKDALMWFEFFAELPEDEELMPHQQEIALAALAQIETAVQHAPRREDGEDRRPAELVGTHVFCRRQGQISARLCVLSDGNGLERDSQDEQMQRAMQVLL